MSHLGVVILFATEAKNAGIAVATASIFNEISGQKNKHNGSCYFFFITKASKTWNSFLSGFLLFETNYRNGLMAISVRKSSALLALNSHLERYASGKTLSKRKGLWTAYQTKECEMTIRMDSTKFFRSVQKLH